MDDLMKTLLRQLLEQEQADTEAGQKIKKRSAKTSFQEADSDSAKRPENTEPDVIPSVRKNAVPIWQKYALSAPEASQYFHIGIRKLREIIAKDRYAEYLMWNGGHVFIKRRLFEEYLDKTSEL